MRHDSGARPQHRSEPRPQLHVEGRHQIQSHHGCIGNVRLESVLNSERYEMLHTRTFRVGLRFLDTQRIDVYSNTTSAESLRRGDDDPAIAAPQVVQNVPGTDVAEQPKAKA